MRFRIVQVAARGTEIFVALEVYGVEVYGMVACVGAIDRRPDPIKFWECRSSEIGGIAIAHDQIFVSDEHGIQVFRPDGSPLRSWSCRVPPTVLTAGRLLYAAPRHRAIEAWTLSGVPQFRVEQESAGSLALLDDALYVEVSYEHVNVLSATDGTFWTRFTVAAMHWDLSFSDCGLAVLDSDCICWFVNPDGSVRQKYELAKQLGRNFENILEAKFICCVGRTVFVANDSDSRWLELPEPAKGSR